MDKGSLKNHSLVGMDNQQNEIFITTFNSNVPTFFSYNKFVIDI